MKAIKWNSIFTLVLLMCQTAFSQTILYTMPEENEVHEATWLQWPHHHTYGTFYRNSLDQTWIDMTESLISSEKVHIIAYDNTEKNRIIGLLNGAGISLANISFFIHPNDDVWVRDNGPMYVYDVNNTLTILDWGFNGWGNDTPYSFCNVIPAAIGTDLSTPVVDLNAMILEGGALEIDGNGTMIATKSSITHSSRNPGLTQTQIENYLTTYVGITHFIWLDGVYGLELTDMHIDGFVKFANDSTMLTLSTADLQYWDLTASDITILNNATDAQGNPYNTVIVPLTQNNVSNTFGDDLGYKGSYVNYYVGNNVVLVPNYNDPNDATANAIIQNYYPGRTVIGIDVRNLYENGGMIHCVTQQQPVAEIASINEMDQLNEVMIIDSFYPNPFNTSTSLEFSLQTEGKVTIVLYDNLGRSVMNVIDEEFSAGKHAVVIDKSNLSNGIYSCMIQLNNQFIGIQQLVFSDKTQ